ncbi:hypothetical protein [Rhizobium leguminosarum]|uniref:hypothetical protein n=1 Tax=Rhizobium leguminosarum TaxID=384 RepID=UPI001AE3FA28|nr:hypothetical protein [Rhizobium leguminosarum]MBP2447363.1 hypothetical protein [Rhizobium leguminosarum]
MIDIITIAGIQGYRHIHRPSGGRADEDQFYAEFGDNSLIRFGAWLTSLDISLKRVVSKAGRRRKAAAQSGGGCRHVSQATFLVPR